VLGAKGGNTMVTGVAPYGCRARQKRISGSLAMLEKAL